MEQKYGKEVMESFLQAENGGKDICALYAHNDDMAVGAIQAIKAAGIDMGSVDAPLRQRRPHGPGQPRSIGSSVSLVGGTTLSTSSGSVVSLAASEPAYWL